jgi:hypothetical protein
MNNLRLLKYTLKTEGSNLRWQISILLPGTGFERFCTKNMWPSLHIYTCVVHLQLQKIFCPRSAGCNTIFYLTILIESSTTKTILKLNLWKRTDGEISSLIILPASPYFFSWLLCWIKRCKLCTKDELSVQHEMYDLQGIQSMSNSFTFCKDKSYIITW